MSEITSLTLNELVKKIKEKKISSQEATEAFIERSKKSKTLNSYITEDFSSALEKAKNFDKKKILVVYLLVFLLQSKTYSVQRM